MIYFNFKSNYLLITLFFGLYFYSFSQTPSREKLEIQKKQLVLIKGYKISLFLYFLYKIKEK